MPVVEVKARFAGEVDLLVELGEAVHAGQGLCEVEGDKQIERLAATRPGEVVAVHVRSGDSVREGQLLLVLR